MKKLLKFFLPLYILLLSGLSTLHAHAIQDCITFCITQNAGSVKSNIPSHLQNTADAGLKSSGIISATLEQNSRLVLKHHEIEEFELTSSVKKLDLNSYYTSPFNNWLLPVHLCRYDKDCFNFAKQLITFPTCRRYVLFRVFRI
ncbi:hypothetical protein [Flavobacterium sp. MK4S-17]|uniref:hypothetical protein n=1 Tax=Flavobacterium sp. MK4S-17 TaxID=2543737 RepID=UPI00135A0443|nr:hypothetical protein [Flavobacterium sp. MK4S-17]